MNNDTKNILKPVLRFKDFTDDWKQRKLNNYIKTSKEKNIKNIYNKTNVLSVSGYAGIVNQIEFQGRSFAGESVSNYGIVYTNDIVYTKSPLKENPFGIIKTNKKETGIVSTLYAVYRPLKITNSNFVQYYFEQDFRLNSYLSPLVNKGAKNDMKVTDDNALLGNVCFPSLEEQNKITKIFSHIDNLITIQQRKCDQLTTLKKYMLANMFPQEGELTPKIRFNGFTDPWEQRKLGELAGKTYGGGTPKTSEDEYWTGEIPWFQSSDLVEDYVLSARAKKGISEIGLQKSASQLVPQNSIAIVTRVGVGKLVFMPFSYTTSQDFLSLSELKIDAKYGCYAIYKMLQKEKNSVQGTSIKGITKEELLSKEIPVPQTPEQVKIREYFKNLDNLITLHQRKCYSLKQVKKFLLQKMFI